MNHNAYDMYFVVFYGLMHIKCVKQMGHIGQILEVILAWSFETSFEYIEVSISYFYALGEGVSEERIKNDNGAIGEIIQLLLLDQVLCLQVLRKKT